MIISNEEVREIYAEIPAGHRHIRTTIVLHNSSEYVFQEATIANLVRAFITIKTHPQKRAVRLTGRKIEDEKAGYAEWQLLEEL